MEESVLNNSSDTEIKEEIENTDEDDVLDDCNNISPKQCHKLQFSIAQIMGFDAKDVETKNELVRHEDDHDDVIDDEEDHQPVKVWRPMAQTPAAAPAPAASVSPSSPYMSPSIFPPDQFPDARTSPGPGPAALALLRHYTFFR